MRSHYRRRSLSSYAFWTALIVGGTLYGAHRFDWFPVGFKFAATSPAESGAAEASPNAATPSQAVPDEKIQVAQGVGQQTEPPPTDADEVAVTHRSENSKSAHARLLEQRAEGSRPKVHANPTDSATAEADFDLPAPGSPHRASQLPSTAPAVSPEIQQTSSIAQMRDEDFTQRPSLSSVDPTVASELQKIDAQLQANDTLSAHRELSTLYWSNPRIRTHLRDRIEKTARAIYFDRNTHFLDPYVVQPGEQLAQIARQYDVPWQYLARLNGAEPKQIRPGQRLKVIKGPFSAIVELNRFLLTVHAYGYFVRAYPIGVGKDSASPVGKFTVLNKVTNPQYTDPEGRVIDGDDPRNPLGERWIDLGNGYGIHGTIDAASIGRAESRGCIRMRNDDVAEVYDLLGVGSQVTIRR